MAVAAEAPAVSPSLEEVRALAREHNLIPLRHTFIDDCETPVSAFLKLREDGPAFLLESADQGQRVGRYSFIGFRPREVIRWSLGEDGDAFDVDAAYAAARNAIADVRWRLAGPVPRPSRAPDPQRAMPAFQSNMPREAFEAMVARIVEYVHAGDAFQVVPSQRWSAPSPVAAFSIYSGQREV